MVSVEDDYDATHDAYVCFSFCCEGFIAFLLLHMQQADYGETIENMQT